MHSVIKSSFYIIFILFSLGVGTHLLLSSKGNRLKKILGFMLVFLGIGEGFHIVPRLLEIFSSEINKYQSLIETGRFISSITILLFYLILYKFWSMFYEKEISKNRMYIVLLIAVIGVVLSIIFKDNTDYLTVTLRNMPLLALGLVVIIKFKKESLFKAGKSFKYLWLALLLSLVFTISFELLSTNFELFIILMMPKSLMFIWVVYMIFDASRKDLLK